MLNTQGVLYAEIAVYIPQMIDLFGWARGFQRVG